MSKENVGSGARKDKPGQAESKRHGNARPKLGGQWAHKIVEKPIEWLWAPYLVRGELNLITGEPGIGKSTIVCDIAAALSTGRLLPGETGKQRAALKSWLLSAEDNAASVIVPRLRIQGADLSKVLVQDEPVPITEAVAREMAARIKKEGFALVMIDPVQAWIGSDRDMHRANDTRAWMTPLRNVAKETGCAIVFLRHRRKGAQGDRNIQAGLGSIDFTGAVRSEIGVTRNSKTDETYISRIKGNVGKTGDGLRYTIEHVAGEKDHGQLVWGDAYVEPAKHSRTPKRVAECAAWLNEYLKDGPQPAGECKEAAKQRGFSDTELEKAKKAAGVVHSQIGQAVHVWRLAS